MESAERESAQQRQERVEIALSNLQRDYDHLNEVVLQQQAQITAMADRLKQLENRLIAAEPDVPHERPPHY